MASKAYIYIQLIENMLLQELGEKAIIEKIIIPLFNPTKIKEWSGDDCAVIKNKKNYICVSTDRVPSDLIAFKLGLINYFDLGHYLAILNISDAAAAGAIPKNLLLNLAFPGEFEVGNLKDILRGIKKACDKYKINIVGGDLSDSKEISLSATIIGFSNKPLFRKGIKMKDAIFCSDMIGLTPTAFKYFLKAKSSGLKLSHSEESVLINQFRSPKVKIELSTKLSKSDFRVSCMDNTDGAGQTFKELSLINKISINIDILKMPIHPLTFKVADFLKMDPYALALEAGADFQILGSISTNISDRQMKQLAIKIIGYADQGKGVNLIKENKIIPLDVKGWNYYL